MLNFIGKIIFFIFVSIFLFSCGGAESYSTPIVNLGDIIQSECKPVNETVFTDEFFSAEVVNGDVVFTHSNIYVPENSVLGIIDTDGNISYDGKFNYFYLEAAEEFISLREQFKYSSSKNNCYYDLRIRISNISGGIYNFMLFNETGKLKYSKEVRVR